LGKVAIVTAAGRLRGIGRAAAVAFAELGCDVVITGTGRNPSTFPQDEKEVGWKDIDSTAEQIRKLGRRALPLVIDVTKEKEVEKMVEEALKTFGRIDFLVNNAAAPIGKDRVPITQLELEEFQKVINVKIVGSYLCSKAVAKVLIKQKSGAIVNVSSVAGKTGVPNVLAYCSANFAVVGMTQSLARELGPHKINVNCVCPGLITTSRIDHMPESRRDSITKMAALERSASDQEVGEFIAYLCTPAASFITGQSINICGGYVVEH